MGIVQRIDRAGCREDVEIPMLVDAMGRIYVDGFHVGWVKRDAGLVELNLLCEVLGCELPLRDAMLKVEEAAA